MQWISKKEISHISLQTKASLNYWLFHLVWDELATQPRLHNLWPAEAERSRGWLWRPGKPSFHHLWPKQQTREALQPSWFHKLWPVSTNQRVTRVLLHNFWSGRVSTSDTTWQHLCSSAILSWVDFWFSTLCGPKINRGWELFPQVLHQLWITCWESVRYNDWCPPDQDESCLNVFIC